MRMAMEASKPDALIVIGAEHFANFFMNNMPSLCIGMRDVYEGGGGSGMPGPSTMCGRPPL
jgi:2,3-dihydroxyphenylpropionate 1,2-dioxygenase